MATHGTLRTDLFDAESIWNEEITVLVPGPSFSENPRDHRLETIRYPNSESVREFCRKVAEYQRVHTLSAAATDDDPIYQAVIHKEDVLYAANPDDPANPSVIATASPLTFKTIVVSGQSDVVADAADDTLTLVAGTNITLTTDATTDTITIDAAGGGGSASNSFVNIAISGQTTVVADSTTDTLTLVAGTGIGLTTDASTDTITIAASGVATEAFKTIAVSGQSNVVADSSADTLTLAAGSGVTITTDASTDTITIAASGGGGGNAFTIIAVSGQSNIEADSTTDTLTVANGGGLKITTNSTTDTLTQAVNLAFFRTTGTITAASYDGVNNELTLGSGDAKQLTLKSGETDVFEMASNPTTTIYNSVTTTILTGKTVQCKLIEGLWVVDVEDCG